MKYFPHKINRTVLNCPQYCCLTVTSVACVRSLIMHRIDIGAILLRHARYLLLCFVKYSNEATTLCVQYSTHRAV